DRASIQTNLSANMTWVQRCWLDRLALWATYHPTQTTRSAFVAKVCALHERGVRMSVGAVGLREHFEEVARLREELPQEIYVWLNAYKRVTHYYEDAEVHFLTGIDPQFPVNNQHHASRDEACFAGQTSFTVDGHGHIRRCHFVAEPIGNIADLDWRSCL